MDSGSNIDVEDTQNNEIPATNIDLERALRNNLEDLVSVAQLSGAVQIVLCVYGYRGCQCGAV